MSGKRILHVIGGMDRAGIETLLMSAYRVLDRSRVQFDFAVTAERPCHFDREIAALGGQILRHPHPSPTPLGFARALRRTLEEHAPYGAVHSHVHFASGLVLAIAAQAGVPVRIAHAHTTADQGRVSVVRAAYRCLMRGAILRCGTHLLATSRAAAAALYGEDCARDPRVRVIPNAIDLEAYETAAGARTLVREELGVPESALLLGHVGRFHPAKNHRFLIEVLAAVQSRRDAYLLLAGDGPLRREVENDVARRGLGRFVRFLGVREDVPRLLGALDVFVFPSLYEGFGLAVIEAQAAGVACIAAAALPEEADASLGLVRRVPLDAGAGAWADAVLESYALPRADAGSCLRVIRERGFGIGRLAYTLEGVYGVA